MSDITQTRSAEREPMTEVHHWVRIGDVPVGTWISRTRREQGRSMGDVSRAIGCPVPRVSDLEFGRAFPTPGEAEALDLLLGTDGRISRAVRRAEERRELLVWASQSPRVLATLEALLLAQRCENCGRSVPRYRALQLQPMCEVCIPPPAPLPVREVGE
jgi:hypothetical protein